jgi:DNA methylase
MGEKLFREASSDMTQSRHRFHSICPYFAMFPESFAKRNILAWSKRDDIVLDPFCGRGTTILESLLNERRAIGCDTNPVAFCISRAKAVPPSLDEILIRLATLESRFAKYTPKAKELDDEFFTACFYEDTLRQILFLRDRLDWRTQPTDCFIAALALGCLHGESHRTDLCFSNRMPRTISTKPAYSVRWWRDHGCVPPPRDVFFILRKAAKYRYESSPPPLKGRVVEGDARKASMLLKAYRQRVKLVVTSPPYLDITDYHEDQWLRLWFLGGPQKPISGQGRDDRHRLVEVYWQFLAEAWVGIVPLLHRSCQIVVRIGGTRLSGEELRSGLLKSLNSSGRKFKLAESHQTEIKNSQRRVFQPASSRRSLEHDFRFHLA